MITFTMKTKAIIHLQKNCLDSPLPLRCSEHLKISNDLILYNTETIGNAMLTAAFNKMNFKYLLPITQILICSFSNCKKYNIPLTATQKLIIDSIPLSIILIINLITKSELRLLKQRINYNHTNHN